MATQRNIAKQTFGLPSAAITERIDASDKVTAIAAANYRYHAQLSDLERQFEAKAAELRESYLDELLAVHQSAE